MRIYSMISIAQLKSNYVLSDSYKRRVNADSSPIIKDDDNSNLDLRPYEIEILLKKKIFRGKKHYLIK